MIVKPELVKKIKEYFDLNIYETKVWLALLTKGIASAGEVAELSGVPRSRTYDVLESLEKRGFAIVRIGKPVKYISVKPTEVLEKMKAKTMIDSQEKVKSLSNLKETAEYTELENMHNSGISPIKLTEITGSLKGRANIMSRIREMFENVDKEILICTSAEDFEDKNRVLAPALERLAKKNIKLKIALHGDAEKIKKINSKFNIKAKSIESPSRFFIADKKETLFMITPESADEEMAIWLSSPYFTETIYNLANSSFN